MHDNIRFPHVYLVPGLGADGRLFNNLVLKDGIETTALRWIEPHPDENISDYAIRMCAQIDNTRPFVLVGVSLGGIVSFEISKHTNPEKIIIISSIKHKNEKPFYFSIGRFLKDSIFQLLQNRIFFRPMVRIFFGKLSKADFEIFKDMLDKTSGNFMKWAKATIVKWDNTQTLDNLYHIHGTRDLIFPEIFIGKHIAVKGGQHIMIMNKAIEISNILNGLLNK